MRRSFAPIEANLALLASQTHRRFIKSHMPLDAIPLFEGVKYIHTARDGRDFRDVDAQCMLGFRPEDEGSYRTRAQPRDPRLKSRVMATSPDPRAYFLDWLAQAEADTAPCVGDELPFSSLKIPFWRERKRENVLLVHYNDMKADLASEMARIATFSRSPFPPA